jgi:hypothetical protein
VITKPGSRAEQDLKTNWANFGVSALADQHSCPFFHTSVSLRRVAIERRVAFGGGERNPTVYGSGIALHSATETIGDDPQRVFRFTAVVIVVAAV